jgi:hypothetical protein
LSRAAVDPGPKVLYGTKAKPGIFTGSGVALRQAAQICQDQGWVEATGQFHGTGKSRKPLYRLTAAGLQEALEHGEETSLLREMLAVLHAEVQVLGEIKAKADQLARAAAERCDVGNRVLDRVRPADVEAFVGRWVAGQSAATPVPPASTADWLEPALAYLAEYQRRHPYAHCPLAELYQRVAEHRRVTIGQFHDGVRQLVERRKVRLHPFTGAAYQLRDEQYALVAGQEIKYYVERLADR